MNVGSLCKTVGDVLNLRTTDFQPKRGLKDVGLKQTTILHSFHDIKLAIKQCTKDTVSNAVDIVG
jgi:hypothetical protein